MDSRKESGLWEFLLELMDGGLALCWERQV